MNARSVGRVAAVIVALGVLVLLGVAWLVTPRPARPANAADPQAPGAPPSPSGDQSVIDPADIGDNIEKLVEKGGRGEWTGRLSKDGAPYRFTYLRLEPREEGVIEVVSPVLWLPGDAQSVVIRAGAGRMHRAKGEHEPTDGRISGGIVASIYEGRISDEGQVNGALLLAEVKLDSLTFERDRLLVRTDDDVQISGEGIDAILHGLSATLSEGDMPLRLLRVAGGGSIKASPDLLKRSGRASATAGTNGAGGNEKVADANPPAGAHPESFYELVLSDAVHLRTGEVALDAGSVRALARLVDGALPDDAIASFDAPRRSVTGTGPDAPASDRGPLAPSAATPAREPQEVAVSWSGPLEIKPVVAAPPELERDSVFVAIHSDTGTGVRVLDGGSGIEAIASAITYGATRRAVALDGGGDVEGVRITVPDEAEFLGAALQMDLTSGVGQAVGPHVVRAIGAAAGSDDPRAPGDEPMWIASTGRADVLLDTADGPIGSTAGGGQILPRSLIFSDGAEARRGESYIKGGSIRASFTEPSQGATLAGIIVRDSARAQDGRGSWIESDGIDILFMPDEANGNGPAPFSARAAGAVRAGSPDASVTADALEAEIVRGASGGSGIGGFTIRGNVGVTLADGAEATGGLITGDARRRTAELSGAPARVSREDESGFASLEAERLALDGVARTLTVAGAGSAEAGSVDGSLSQRLVSVRWDRSLVYDDARGRAEIAGAVRVRADEDVLTDSGQSGARVHTAGGDRVTLEFGSPLGEDGGVPLPRRLTRALVEGLSDEAAGWARVESRLYAIDDRGARRLLGVLFITGPLMDAAPEAPALVVAGPGRLLIDNRVRGDRPEDARLIGADPGSLDGVSGTSLFEWSERLDLDGAAGSARMSGAVSFRHVDDSGGPVTDLRADLLEAGFDAGGVGAEHAALRDVVATGSVVVRRGSLQIDCDAARYDAGSGEIVAAGSNGRRISVLDDSTGRRQEAGAVRLNLTTGAWKIVDPSAISIPVR